jgi:hypothetical protein
MSVKYCDYESFESFNESVNYVIDIYHEKLNYFYNDEKCILFKKGYNVEEHKGLQHLKRMKLKLLVDIMNCKRTISPCIDDVLTTYMVCFLKITKDENLLEIVVTLCILLREYLNNVGWDYKKKFFDFGVDIGYSYIGAYCSFNSAENIPDLINDFISVFLNMDSLFRVDEKILLSICDNFCNWLFVNNFTSLKLYPNNTGERIF